MSDTASNTLPDTASDPLDPARWETLTALQEATGSDFLDEVIDLFMSDTPQRLSALRDAVATRDAAAGERMAHSLKGSCSNIGAQVVGSLAAEAEARLAQGSFEGVDDLLARLESETTRAFEALEDRRPRR